MRKSLIIMFIVGFIMVLSACNQFRRINEEIVELDAEKKNVVAIGEKSFYKNGKDYLFEDLLKEEASRQGFAVKRITSESPFEQYPTYFFDTVYYMVVLTDQMMDQKPVFALFGVDLESLAVIYMDRFVVRDSIRPNMMITTDQGYLLIFTYDDLTLHIYENDNHTNIQTFTLDSSSYPTGYNIHIREGILYIYYTTYYPRVQTYEAYEYLTQTLSYQVITEIQHPSSYGARIKIEDDDYQLVADFKNYDILYVYKNEVKIDKLFISEIINRSERGQYILGIIKKKGHSLIPGYIYTTAFDQSFYILIQYDEGLELHRTLFGKTAYLMFSWNYVDDQVFYLGSSEHFMSTFIDLND